MLGRRPQQRLLSVLGPAGCAWAPGQGAWESTEAGRPPRPSPALQLLDLCSPVPSVLGSPSANGAEASSSLSLAPMPQALGRPRREFWLQSPSLLSFNFPLCKAARPPQYGSLKVNIKLFSDSSAHSEYSWFSIRGSKGTSSKSTRSLPPG